MGESLYLRPFLIATEVGLGVRPSNHATYVLIATPAAAYFNAAKAVTVWISTEYVRAALGGTGEAKCGGNYAASLLAQKQAAQEGCDQVAYIDAVERKWVEEMGGMNLYFIKGSGKDATIMTPKLTGTLLPGITRDSILTLANDLGYKTEESMISIDQWRDGVKSGEITEIFACGTAAVISAAKSHDRHVDLALKTNLDENLAMITDSIKFLKSGGQRVFLDAEHFFDGYLSNKAYALEVVRAAVEAGADVVALCDTNGGMLPDQLSNIVHEVLTASKARLGIHCHNDTGCAVANSLAAISAGVTHVQGTLNGYGERTGNADLVNIIANLELKKEKAVLPTGKLQEAFRISHAVAEITNVAPSARQPYVGTSAFAHKAGLHASAIKVDPMMYQHETPESVGNDMRMLVSEMAGRASIELKSAELGIDLGGDKDLIGRVVEKVKELEGKGFTFEAADASFELLLRTEVLGKRPSFFTIEDWQTTVHQDESGKVSSKATVKIHAKNESISATGVGNGPVNAIDNALRSGLEKFYPELAKLELTDYKVRILEGRLGTGAVTRVLVETSDGEGEWSTVGVHENVIAASAMALDDAVTYGLLRQGRKPE
ncbi:MAG: citramalate synthase [Actinobacteria bacterium]|nr:citramalate synthase [Actinomycetota bacterium]